MDGSDAAGRSRQDPDATSAGSAGDEIPLATLFARMRSSSPETADAAWGEVYRRYHQRVWARVFYVIRTIPWLREPREVASDVTTEVFVGLPAAVSRYTDMGRAEAWLLRVALRTALRHKEKLTGNWSDGRRPSSRSGRAQRTGRSYFDLDDAVEHISHMMYEVELDERLELNRRLDEWRDDPARARWLQLIELFVEGYGHDEIAERLGITPGTSRTWLWKIRQELARPRDAGDMSDEVGGRGEPDDGAVVPIRPGAGPHLDDEALERFADGMLDAEADAAAEAHIEACAICDERAADLRRGLAVLALGSATPGDIRHRIDVARTTGARPLLPVEASDAGEPVLGEAVGRDAGDDDDDPAER